MSLRKSDLRGGCCPFVVSGRFIRLDPRSAHGERTITVTVCFGPQKCRVIRTHEDAVVALTFQPVVNGADDFLVNLLHGFYLGGDIAFV